MLNTKHTSKIIKSVKINNYVPSIFFIISQPFKNDMLKTRYFRYANYGVA